MWEKELLIVKYRAAPQSIASWRIWQLGHAISLSDETAARTASRPGRKAGRITYGSGPGRRTDHEPKGPAGHSYTRGGDIRAGGPRTPDDDRTARQDGCTRDHRRPSHSSKMVPSTIYVGGPTVLPWLLPGLGQRRRGGLLHLHHRRPLRAGPTWRTPTPPSSPSGSSEG